MDFCRETAAHQLLWHSPGLVDVLGVQLLKLRKPSTQILPRRVILPPESGRIYRNQWNVQWNGIWMEYEWNMNGIWMDIGYRCHTLEWTGLPRVFSALSFHSNSSIFHAARSSTVLKPCAPRLLLSTWGAKLLQKPPWTLENWWRPWGP